MIPYKHEPFNDFSVQENKDDLEEGMKTVQGYLGDLIT